MLNVDVADRLVIVVGCGPAGQEKVDRLLAAGARVRVVDPAPPTDLDSRVEIVERAVEVDEATSDWLDDAWLVVAATGRPTVDEWVQATAEARATWVVRADRSDGGGVSFAATIEQPPVVVGVTTGGSSPTLASWLRDRVAEVVPAEIGRLAELLAQRQRSDGRRRHRDVSLDDAIEALERGDDDLAEQIVNGTLGG